MTAARKVPCSCCSPDRRRRRTCPHVTDRESFRLRHRSTSDGLRSFLQVTMGAPCHTPAEASIASRMDCATTSQGDGLRSRRVTTALKVPCPSCSRDHESTRLRHHPTGRRTSIKAGRDGSSVSRRCCPWFLNPGGIYNRLVSPDRLFLIASPRDCATALRATDFDQPNSHSRP